MSVRADLHTDSGLQRYIAGMDASMQDKARIIPLIDHADDGPLALMELGCGSGAVLELLSNIPGENHIVGVDFSAKLLGHAAQRNYGDQRVILSRGRIQDCSFFGKFDAIIMCSVLHEIWSQARTENPEVDLIDALGPLFRHCAQILKPGGSIIIRDGIKLDAERVILEFKNDVVRTKFFRFADDYKIEQLAFIIESKRGTVSLTIDQLYEFLTKYFYDENWDVEVREEFGWASQDDIWRLAMESNLTVSHMEDYQLQWLGENWAKDFKITYTDGSVCEPSSTMLAKLTKNS